MTIRADSYSTLDEVAAFTRHLLDGAAAYDTTTRPTLAEVERFIDRASGILNLALAGAGLTVPITQEVAKLACDDWVTSRAAEYVELTQRGVGYSEGEGSRTTAFRNMQKAANQFAAEMKAGFENLGVIASHSSSSGLQFTGMDSPDNRSDPLDTTLEQPLFTRHQFDNAGTTENE